MKFEIIVLAVSMAVVTTLVNASTNESAPVIPHSSKSGQENTAKGDEKKEVAEIIAFLTKNGHKSKIGENVAPDFGFSGPMPTKGNNIRNQYNATNRDALNCAIIYKNSDTSESEDNHPIGGYLMRIKESGDDRSSQNFIFNLDGHLEKVFTIHGKRDASGHAVRGSGVTTVDDLSSAKVRETFAAEMKEVMKWLKAQKKLAAQKPAAKAE